MNRGENTSDHPPVVERPLFFLDYDGTLAPIVDKPMEAVPHPDVPVLLKQLRDKFPVRIITGRHLRDLAVLMPEASHQAVGLHGTQEGTIGGEINSLLSRDAESALEHLRQTLPETQGVEVEDKGPTFAVHYRSARDEAAVRAKLEEWADNVPEVLETIWGKKVVELRPRGQSKGTAVRQIADEYPDHTPIYLGDDVTDEDAFEALGEEAVTVKIGTGKTTARYRLDGVEEVVAYLEQYV